MDFHSMKRKELQALCKKHKIPANLKNLELANRLTSLLKGEDKKLGENGREIESDVEYKRVKKVRFSPETQTFEFQKSEVKYVTRSRGRRLVEKGTAAKKKEGKGGIKNEASGSILPSDVENKSRVMTRKSSRRREVVDWGKSKNEDMESGLKKKGRERNLRQGKDKARDNIAEGGERDVEFMEIGVEKVFRRSKRNVTKVEDYKLMSGETVAAGSSLKPVNRAATEAVEEKEKSPVVLGLRRSTRNASGCNEPLITLDDLVADVNYERKRKRQRRDPVEEHETVLIDRISIELPLAPLSLNVNSSERAVPESVVGNFAQKTEREPKKQTVEIEDSLCKDLTSEELPDVDVQPSLAEVTEGAIARDSEYKSFMDNRKKQKRRSGSSSGRKSPPKAQDSSKGVNMKITASESIEMDNIEPGVGTSHCRTNEIDQSGSTDSKGIQVWVELSIDMEKMSRPASLDHLVEDERISSVKSQEYIKDQGFERFSGNGLERDENASLNGLRERDRSTSSIKDKASEGNPANVKDAVPNYNGDCSGTFNLGRALLDHQDLSQTMQTNNVEIDNMSGDRNVDQEELICSKSGKSDKSLKENYDTTVTRMLGDENDNGGEIPEQPACLEMKHLGALSTDDNVTETSCSRIEYGTLISSSETIENVPELNSTLDDPESSIDVMDYKPLEPRKQSPNIQLKDVGLKDATEAERHFEDAKISADLPKLDEKEHIPDKYLESNPFDSLRCKLNMLGDIDANVGKGFVGDVDSEKFNLATEAFSADTISESNESYKSQPDKDGDANLIEFCIQEAKKVDNNFGEQASSEVSMTAEVSTIMMKVDITLEQKWQSPILNICGSEADNVAEEDMAPEQLDLKNCNELDQSVEDGHIDKPRQSHNLVSEYSASDPSKRSMRRMLKNDVLNSSGSSKGNTANLEGKKVDSAGIVELSVGEKCLPAENTKYDENPTNSEDVAVTTKCRTSISLEHNYDESSAAMNLGLEQREQSPLVQWKGGEAGCVAKVNRNYDQGKLKYDGQCYSPNECRTSIIPDTSIRRARRILQDEIDDEDSLGLQKNDVALEKIYKVQFNGENFSFIQPCMREQCTSAEGDNNYKENPTNFDNAMAAMKTEDANSTMNLDIASGQRVHSPAADRNGCEADSVAEVDRNYGKRELKSDELSNNIEDRPFDEKYHFRRSILKGGEDSTECQNSPTRKTFEDESVGFVDFHVMRKCNSIIDDNSEEVLIYFESPMRAILSASGDLSHIPFIDKNEHTASRSSDMALDQREQTPVQQINDCHADNVTEGHEIHAQLVFYCDESAESVDDRCMDEHHHLPNKCPVSKVYYSPRSASRMLQDEIVGGSEDSMKCLEHYKVAPEEDETVDPNESFVIGRYTSTNDYEEDNPENSKDAIKEITRTVKFALIPMVDKNEEHIGTRNLEMKLEKSEQSLAMQQNGCQTDTVAENDRNHEHNELSCDESAKSVEGRPSEEHCNSPNKCQMQSLSNLSRTVLEDKSANAGKDFNKSEIKEVSTDCNKIEHSTSPDASAQKQENIKNAMNDVADAFRTSEVKNYIELASFQTGNNNAEGVDVTKLQKEVVDVEAGDTSVEGIPSPLSNNDAQELVLTAGDELFAENGTKEDSYRISENISNFASSEQPSKANFNFNNFQEEFSCKDQENNGDEKQENLTSIFSQVQFAMPEIHGEDKIVNIVDDVSSNLLYKNHEILKESDVADTINEYIESESTVNPSSLRIDDTSETLKISVFTKVPEPEDKVAEERNDIITGRKSELSLERDQEKVAAELEGTALRSAKISDGKPTTTQRKNSDIVADKNIVLGQQLTSEMREKDMRAILIHGTPRKLQMAANMKENLPSFKIEKVGSLTTVKPTAKRTALKHVFIQKK